MVVKYNCLNAKLWSFTAPDTGKQLSGCTVYATDPNGGTTSPDFKGVDIVKISFAPEIFSRLPALPALLEFKLTIQQTTKGAKLIGNM